MWDSMEWIKAMVGSRKRRRRRKRLAFKDILSTSRRAGESTNHGNDLEEGGDEEEVDKEHSEEQGGVRPGLLPLTQGDLRASE